MNNNIRKLRQQQKLSVRELSLISNVAMGNIYDLEKGRQDIMDCKLYTLVRLSKALKCRVKDLVVDKMIKRKI